MALVRLLPSLLTASASEIAAFRARMRERYRAPAGTPADKADEAFETVADAIVAYLSSPIPSEPNPPFQVGHCRSCEADDCFATAEPWAAPLTYIDGQAYVTGGFCCAHEVGWDRIGDCAHPMRPVER